MVTPQKAQHRSRVSDATLLDGNSHEINGNGIINFSFLSQYCEIRLAVKLRAKNDVLFGTHNK